MFFCEVFFQGKLRGEGFRCFFFLGVVLVRFRFSSFFYGRAQRIEYDESGVRVGGVQWVLGSVAVYGVVEFGGNSFQYQFFFVEFGVVVQEAVFDSRLREYGFRKDFVLLVGVGQSRVTGGVIVSEQEGVEVGLIGVGYIFLFDSLGVVVRNFSKRRISGLERVLRFVSYDCFEVFMGE